VRLAWIEARDFRNHRETALEVPSGLVAVVGPNGQGKTNLLEAMHYLCALASPRVHSDMPLVRVGASTAVLRGEVVTETGRFLIEVEVRPSGQNRIQVNRTAVRRRRDLRASVRAVFSGPDDLSVIQGEPDQRRRFMDETLVTLWPSREPALTAYERTLRQRNRLLKDWDGRGLEPEGLTGWDAQLVTAGAAVTALRAQGVRAIRSKAAAEFSSLTGDPKETLASAYVPSVPGGEQAASPEDVAPSYERRLGERRPDELIRRTSLVGPHRDDLNLEVEGLVARGFASHGEAWGAAVSLRLALAAATAEEIGEPPITYLDDPFSPFDPERRARMASSLGGRGQVFLAVPDDAQIPSEAAVWRVKEGSVTVE
jgi:DNA replication and repair protein RecF